jgi:16S rRNA (uracil1498-N3)-methyltransferase
MAHRVYFPDLPEALTGSITIEGDEAHHALRVKRLEHGDGVEVCDGRGLVALTRLSASSKTRQGWAMELWVERIERRPQVTPFVTIASAAPKGERLEAMIDGLSQAGAGRWVPLLSRRTIVDPGEGKLARLERTVVESMKQCGRAWTLELGTPASFEQALAGDGHVVVAEADGADYVACGHARVTVLIGPEGGWDPHELEKARASGVTFARFGPHVMRTEVAAVVAAAQVLSAERAFRARAV